MTRRTAALAIAGLSFALCTVGAQAQNMVTQIEAYGIGYSLIDHAGQCAVSTDGKTPALFLNVPAPCGFVSQDGDAAQLDESDPVRLLAIVAGPPVAAADLDPDTGALPEQMCANMGQVLVIDGQLMTAQPAQIEPVRFCHRLGVDQTYFQTVLDRLD